MEFVKRSVRLHRKAARQGFKNQTASFVFNTVSL